MTIDNLVFTDLLDLRKNKISFNNIKELLLDKQGKIENHSLLGEYMDNNSNYQNEINLYDVTHVIESISLEDDKIVGTIRLLDTPKGVFLKEVLKNDKFNNMFKISTRLRIDKKKEYDVIGDLFQKCFDIDITEDTHTIDDIITWDIVNK